MKKKILVITGFLFLLIAGVMISAPLLIESQKVQDQILSRIKSWYVVDASVKDITFTWFPFPHLEIEQIKVLHPNFSTTSPQATLYPSWKVFFDFSSMGRLHIVDPVFQLHEAPADDQAVRAFAITLPNMKVHIKNGTIILPEQKNGIFATQQVTLRNISASLSVHRNRGTFDWESAASFAKHIAFNGDFGPQGYGTIKGKVQGLDGGKISSRKYSSLFATLEDRSNFSFLANRRADGLHANLQGEIPDFSLFHQSAFENFRLSTGNFELHIGSRKDFSLIIKDLLFQEPRFEMAGEIARYFADEQNNEANIKIDLHAKDIDLTAIRHKVHSLLADSEVAATVCDIVQGGEAHSASYFFDAPVKAFEDVTSMTIAVDIAHSDIHLADIPLDLKNAQGPILIKDGDLTGKDITTWVGDAKGTNGVFLVGLADDKHGLLVDVDIDANLEELPAVLRSLLDDQDVVRELGTVQGRGRANGHLHIGDNLNDFNVIVDVDRYQDAELRYERLSWPLRPESGSLQVTGTSVSWKGIKANMGSHSIQETSGHASWQDNTVPFAITSFHGFFDANTLLGELQQYSVLDEAFSGVITAVQGSIEATGSLAGPFFSPLQYSYSFDARLKDLTLTTPALPEKIMIDEGQATIGHQEIKILSSSGSLFSQPIHLSGELLHSHWQNWRGNLQANGVLAEEHLNWLKDKGTLSRRLALRPPYRLDNINIRWDNQLLAATGKLFSADDTTSLDLDIQEKGYLSTRVFKIKSPRDSATLSLQWDDRKETFTSSFSGKISAGSFHALLGDSGLGFESISGNFKVHKANDKKSHKTLLDFSGNLLARDLHWVWGKDKRTFTIPALDLVGEDSLLRIRELKTDFNDESMAATGTFLAKPGAGHIVLDITAPPTLTTTNIEKFQDDLDYFLHTTLAINKEQEIFSSYDISGYLNFNLSSLIMPFGTDGDHDAKGHSYRLPFTPLKGNYLFNEHDSTLNLQSSEVCGVRVDGQLTWQGPLETRKELSLLSPADAPLDFKEFLSCFNLSGVVEGPLNISGRIYSDTKLCKRGGLLLYSEKGTIKKFVALAKTLSLINITGLSGAIWTEGFYYNALEISGNICDNIFTIDKAFIDGDGVDVVATGDINLSTMEYDVTLYVVPFSTINGLVTMVPLVGRVLGGQEGRIVSVPVKVTGPLDDPSITVLSPSAIGEATGKWILDTITLPFGWMIPGKTENSPEQLPEQPSERLAD